MRALYFDCYAGVSGDMIVGGLIDLGVDPEHLKRSLAPIKISGYEIESSRVMRSGIAAARFGVKTDPGAQPLRSLDDIRELIEQSPLSVRVKARSITVFESLAEAESRVHSATSDQIHFHEVGAVDSIVDVVGAMVGFEYLGVERFFSSPLRLGHGFVETRHGRLPIPAPGTLELLKGVPVYGGELEGEFVTPTGAAIVKSLCEAFTPMPVVTVERVGYGAGSRDPKGFPNALRIVAGELPDAPQFEVAPGRVAVLETNIDDMNPQAYGYVMERAFRLGALDVFATPVQMKKNRPGVLFTVLCEPKHANSIIEMLLAETTSLGVRYYQANRRVLERRVETVETTYGIVRIKVALDCNRALHFQPEYDDCARLAGMAGVPLLEVEAAANAAYREKLRSASDKH